MRRNADLVFKLITRMHVDKDVVAIAPRRNTETVKMKVACLIRQAIAKSDLQTIPGPRAQHRWQI